MDAFKITLVLKELESVPDLVAQSAEHWASIPKVVGSNPTVARHIFQALDINSK